MERIENIIDDMPIVSDIRKEFYKNIIYCRYQILKETYNKLKNIK